VKRIGAKSAEYGGKPEGAPFVFSEIARAIRRTVAGRLFGFELVSLKPGRSVLRMKVRAKHIQIHGVVHGGIVAALADTAAALAGYPMLPRGTQLATIEMKINYLEPLDRGEIVAEGRVLRRGRNFVVSECEVFDPQRRLAAKALMTFAIAGPRGASSPRAKAGRSK